MNSTDESDTDCFRALRLGIGRGLLLSFGFVLWSSAWEYCGVIPRLLANRQKPPYHWPVNSQVELNPSGATLVLFAHPRCPCTRATLTELQRILTHSPANVTTWVVFFRPLDAQPDWEQGNLWNAAAAIGGVHVIDDPGGALAERFHVFTSGQTLLYDSTGDLQFSGGITSARGHEGDNVGQTAIIQFLTQGSVSTHETPVFGCAIAARSQSD